MPIDTCPQEPFKTHRSNTSTDFNLSFIWSAVESCKTFKGPPVFATLDAALEAVSVGAELRPNLRHHSDVIDLKGDFSVVTVDGRMHLLKATSLDKGFFEREAAIEAEKRLRGVCIEGFAIHPVVPELRISSTGKPFLVAEYLSKTLRERGFPAGLSPLGLLNGLLEVCNLASIRWPGAAPRNVIVDPDHNIIHLLDWENTDFLSTPADWTMDQIEQLKFVVDWSMFLNSDAVLDCLGVHTVLRSNPVWHPYELALQERFVGLSLSEIRSICVARISEALTPVALPDPNVRRLSRYEFYQIVCEVLTHDEQFEYVSAVAALPRTLEFENLLCDLQTSATIAFLRAAGASRRRGVDMGIMRRLMLQTLPWFATGNQLTLTELNSRLIKFSGNSEEHLTQLLEFV